MKQKLFILVFFVLGVSVCVAQNTYQVGDLFIDEAGNAGIVFYLLPDQSGGWVVALNDVDSVHRWGAFHVNVPELTDWNNNIYVIDTSGYWNTYYLRNALQNDYSDYMVWQVDFDHGWYVPAINQLTWLFAQLPIIESKFAVHGGTTLSEDLYWSSTEINADKASCLNFQNGKAYSYIKNLQKKVRPVRSFTYYTVHYDTSLTYLWSTGSTQPYINPSPQQTTTYTVTATNEWGCDATDSKTIFVAENMPQEFYDEICQGEPYEANGFSVTAAETSTPGLITRTRTVTNDGCSATVTLYLTVHPTATTEINEEGCGTYLWNGVTLYEEGNYEQHFFTANGCDSTVILHLALHIPDTTYQIESACESYTLNGINYNYSGTYTQHLTNGNGCDSVVILDLTILQSQNAYFDTTVYDGLHWGDSYWTETDDYSVTYTNQFGCDSIVTRDCRLILFL